MSTVFLMTDCGLQSADDGNGTGGLSHINDWIYQLQGDDEGIDLEAIGETAFDLVVIDYSSDGSEEGEFSSDQIGALKNSSGGAKVVLSYMSIGEAEEGRFYFDSDWVDGDNDIQPGAPSFLAVSNPDFPDNYKVRYWEEGWQEIIFGYLDRIVEAGFDGVYLDIIDAFEFFGSEGEMPERETAGEEMINFVIAIAERARGQVPGFLVFPQNGATILDEEGGDEYLEAVDGIGAEDTFYFGDEDNDNELDLDNASEVTPTLDRFVEEGKTVLAIDYVQDLGKIADFYDRASERGYLPYASIRDLDEITVNEGFEPD